ncbi:MAG: bifunctional methylenetetrahydrofolate dehydrogenase/methenyltetrahydrofolate cyclohydrolase FolD [Actinomycetota bacterium]
MTTVIDGRKISADIRSEVAEGVAQLKKETGVTAGLAVIIVGEDPGSQIYVRNKEKACEETGIYSEKHELPADVSEEELITLVNRLNDDPNIHGLLVQLPLPKHIDEDRVIDTISVKKDVDGFTPVNVGNMLIGKDCFLPCTPHGIIILLQRVGIDISGKDAVIVGRSNIVGKPAAILLMQNNATVTICHSRTKDLATHTGRADILVVGIGQPKMITADMVKEGAAVIDAGINRDAEGKVVGDVDYDGVFGKVGAITPVPGGVGMMTVAMLMYNTLEAARKAAASS